MEKPLAIVYSFIYLLIHTIMQRAADDLDKILISISTRLAEKCIDVE